MTSFGDLDLIDRYNNVATYPLPIFTSQAAAEDFVTHIWELGLRGKKAALDTPYWSLGINANRALYICRELWHTTGIDLPANLFVEAPTIRLMAARFFEKTAMSAQEIVRMRDGDDAFPPFFLFPGGGGFLHELTDYARALDVPGVVYGVPTSGMDGSCPFVDNYEEEAVRTSALIQRIQKKGPYFLAGYSMGGCTALETARIILDSREQVYLMLLDTGLSDHSWPFNVWLRFMTGKLRSKIVNWNKKVPMQDAEHLDEGRSNHNPRQRGSQFEFRFRNPRRTNYPYYSRYWQPHQTPKYSLSREYAIRMKGLYNPSSYPGPVTVFLSKGGEALSCSPTDVWQRYLSNVEWVPVSGTHSSMLIGRYAKQLAMETSARVKRELNKTQSEV